MDFFKFGERDDRIKTEIQAKKKKQQEFKFIKSINHRPGHTLFSINTITGEIKEAEFKREDTITWQQAKMIFSGVGLPKKVIIESNCVYIEALNKENALKHYRNGCNTD